MSYLHDLGIVCTLGDSKQTVTNALLHHPQKEYLRLWKEENGTNAPLFCGQISSEEELPDLSDYPLPFRSRNNQIALLAYRQISSVVSELTHAINPSRVAVVVGTTTSGIKEGEIARAAHNKTGKWPENYDYSTQEMLSPAAFLASVSGAKGPIYSISTACSSGAKALASARALLKSGLADVVICGGVDTLSHLPNDGFCSLSSIASEYCNPLSAERDGINIGEGAALFVMSNNKAEIELCGVGESADAYHISAPHPEGLGAISAMRGALDSAGLSADKIDYINLHGTATMKNDEMEAKAVSEVFGQSTLCSSTKRFTGHTLGAAGAIEAAILWLLLSEYNPDSLLPINKSDFGIDPKLAKIRVCETHESKALRYCLSNSFAFGGNNISVILGKK